MRRLAVDAFDVFIEGLVETKIRVKEAVANICQANCKEGCKTFGVSPFLYIGLSLSNVLKIITIKKTTPKNEL